MQAVGNDNRPEIKAIVAWSDLGSGYTRNAPIQGQGADHANWTAPPVPSDTGPDDLGKLDRFDAVSGRGVDVHGIIIEGGTHLASSHVIWSYTATWSEEISLFDTLAWFAKYLAAGLERGGATATQRLQSNHESSESPGHGLSRKVLSAYSVGGDCCRDQRDREIDCPSPTNLPDAQRSRKRTTPPNVPA